MSKHAWTMTKVSAIKSNPHNPRTITSDKFKKLVRSLRAFPEMLEARPIVVDGNNVVLGGNMRLKAAREAGLEEVPVYRSGWSHDKNSEFIIKDNVGFGEWDWDVLANEWEAYDLEAWGLDVWVPEEGEESQPEVEDRGSPLVETFLIPPFTVLDARQGYWMKQKQQWRALIEDRGETREEALSSGIVASYNNGTSIFDPVLCQIMLMWFNVDGGRVADPFAGGPPRGYVSGAMGMPYTGIEIRSEQIATNQAKVPSKDVQYILGDGCKVGDHIEHGSQDMVLTCPPYFNLEVYSDLKEDLSNMSWHEFEAKIDQCMEGCYQILKPNRFAVFVVGDVRDKNGAYYQLPQTFARLAQKNGFALYNELIFVEPLGTIPQRARRYMDHRKVAKCHQNVLVFYKGDPAQVKKEFPDLNLSDAADFDVITQAH